MSEYNYDFKVYDSVRPNVGVTVVPIKYDGGVLKALVYKRAADAEVFQDQYCLPNWFFNREEFDNDKDVAVYALEKKASVVIPHMEQLKTYSGNYIDPQRIVTVNIAWVAITTENEVTELKDKSFETKWVDVDVLMNSYELAFNHDEVLKDAVERVKSKAEYTNIACDLLGEEFTIKDFKKLTEILIGQAIDNSRFRDRIKKTELLVEIEGKFKKGAHRPAQLFRKNNCYKDYFYPKSLTKPS